MEQNIALPSQARPEVTVLGAGLSGLSCAYALDGFGYRAKVLEKNPGIGGLARTIETRGFRYDLGGHRFLSDKPLLNHWLKILLQGTCLEVKRSSRIYRQGRLIHYPLRPMNVLSNVSPKEVGRIALDYFLRKQNRGASDIASLEDWVKSQYGETLYSIFFKDYSEKVWGLPCNRIDQDWIAKRIQNMSLTDVFKEALFKIKSMRHFSLTDKFLYPAQGIGSLADSLAARLAYSKIYTNAHIEAIEHDSKRINGIRIRRPDGSCSLVQSDHYFSSLPVSTLVRLMQPGLPPDLLACTKSLKSRDLIIVTLFINKERVSQDNWVYFPDKDVPFGRIHEPKNWSKCMAPNNKTAVVAEYFCNRGDPAWMQSDSNLIQKTVEPLESMGFFNSQDLLGGKVLRIKNAYPLFSLNYGVDRDAVFEYFNRFDNLSLIGRSGLFRYYNMDEALLSGMDAALNLVGGRMDVDQFLDAAILKMNNKANILDEMRTHNTGVAA